ncbi:hypothetical protein FRX31_029713, partial [Thalictrum thalictroides]
MPDLQGRNKNVYFRPTGLRAFNPELNKVSICLMVNNLINESSAWPANLHMWSSYSSIPAYQTTTFHKCQNIASS